MPERQPEDLAQRRVASGEEKETHFWNSTDGFILFSAARYKGSLRVDTVSGIVKTSFYFIREMQSARNAQNYTTTSYQKKIM